MERFNPWRNLQFLFIILHCGNTSIFTAGIVYIRYLYCSLIYCLKAKVISEGMKDSIGLKYNNKSGFPLDFFVLKAAIDLVNQLLNAALCNKSEIC